MKSSNNSISLSEIDSLIDSNCVVVGNNAIHDNLFIFLKYIYFVVSSDNIKSPKVKNSIDFLKKNNVFIIYSSKLIRYLNKRLNLHKRNINFFLFIDPKLRNIVSLNDFIQGSVKLKHSTVVAFPSLDYEYNIGSMIRTSYAFGVDAILIPKNFKNFYSPAVTKISTGYNYQIRLIQDKFVDSLRRLKDAGFCLYCFDSLGGENISKVVYNPKACFVFGDEAKGIEKYIMSECDYTIAIPMQNGVESLSVSVSLGIALYDRKYKQNICL